MIETDQELDGIKKYAPAICRSSTFDLSHLIIRDSAVGKLNHIRTTISGPKPYPPTAGLRKTIPNSQIRDDRWTYPFSSITNVQSRKIKNTCESTATDDCFISASAINHNWSVNI